jgi:hypothetical protein
MWNFEQHSWTVGSSDKIVSFLKILKNFTKLPENKQTDYLEKNWISRYKAKQLNDFIKDKYSDWTVNEKEYWEIVKYLNDLKSYVHNESIQKRLSIKGELENKWYKQLWIIQKWWQMVWWILRNHNLDYGSKDVTILWWKYNPKNLRAWLVISQKIVWAKSYIFVWTSKEQEQEFNSATQNNW